jgi:hypothetical protein
MPTPDYPISTDSSRYQTVANSTAQACGPSGGAAGDRLAGVLLVPSSLSPGAVTIKDGSGSAITVFAGGTNSLLTLHPFFVPLGIDSATGAWTVTTSTGLTAVAVGRFA